MGLILCCLVIMFILAQNIISFSSGFNNAANALKRDSEIMSCIEQERGQNGYLVFRLNNKLEVVECKAKRCFDKNYNQSYYREGRSWSHTLAHPNNPNLGCKVMQPYESQQVRDIYKKHICNENPNSHHICKTDL